MTVSHALPDAALREVDTPVDTALARPCEQCGDIDLAAWAARAVAGDVIEYHRGHLAEDRNPTTSRLPEAACARVDRIADTALAMEAAGQVLLMQRRLGDGVFDYLAIKAVGDRRPTMPMVQRAGR